MFTFDELSGKKLANFSVTEDIVRMDEFELHGHSLGSGDVRDCLLNELYW